MRRLPDYRGRIIRLTDERLDHVRAHPCNQTLVGDKHLRVVVKTRPNDAFVITAYLTDSIKRGVLVWPRAT